MRVSAGTSSVTNEQAGKRPKAGLFAGALVAALIAGGAAHAESYKFGEVAVSVDTTLSAGVGMRTSKRDCSHVSLPNGGCYSSSGRSTGVNSDNGNLNFDQWDFTDAIGRATVDVQAKWENYGVFLRPTAFYNLVYANNDMRFRDLNHDARGQLEYNVDVLDAFVYGDYDIGGHATTIRIGKQALNWGESLFIQGGVNAFQAIDVTAIRTPGAELKDALTPMPMIYASFAATDALTLEAFWQFGYEKTELDPAGSFFSTDDIVGKGRCLPSRVFSQASTIPTSHRRMETRSASSRPCLSPSAAPRIVARVLSISSASQRITTPKELARVRISVSISSAFRADCPISALPMGLTTLRRLAPSSVLLAFRA